MLLFAAHDPGARNHVWPVYQHALNLGEEAKYIDLTSRSDLMNWESARQFIEKISPRLLFSGCSIRAIGGGIDPSMSPPNGEWPLARACKFHEIPSIAVVDFTAKGKLDGMSVTDFPDSFLTTNLSCTVQLHELGANPEAVILTGSTHLEHYMRSEPAYCASEVKTLYGLDRSRVIVPFFCGPDTTAAVEAVASIIGNREIAGLIDTTLVIRAHPRAPNQYRFHQISRCFSDLIFDEGATVDNLSLLKSSPLSFSMGSAVSLESLVVGTPSAFYQIDWSYAALDELYQNLETIPRIRNTKELSLFVSSVLKDELTAANMDAQQHAGAITRSWEVLSELL